MTDRRPVVDDEMVYEDHRRKRFFLESGQSVSAETCLWRAGGLMGASPGAHPAATVGA